MAADYVLDRNTAVFLDTNVVVAATVEAHPDHRATVRLIDELVSRATQLCISPQICREFLVVLTRQPVSERVFSIEEAVAALEVWTTGCIVLDETDAVMLECLRLIERHRVLGKQIHDCNVVATMRVHGVPRLATRNAADFKRFHAEVTLLSVTE